MIAKLGVLILASGVGAAGLLVVRQQRLQAVHEMAVALDSAAKLDRDLWRIRAEVAAAITPLKVLELTRASGEWRPIVRGAAPLPGVPEPVGAKPLADAGRGEGTLRRGRALP
ncbi:MAG: hypothetical protein IBJ11_06795 [Phycisphaerales bacterium]|nr:hypothetical protein [Phycisphaerales bacterium]